MSPALTPLLVGGATAVLGVLRTGLLATASGACADCGGMTMGAGSIFVAPAAATGACGMGESADDVIVGVPDTIGSVGSSGAVSCGGGVKGARVPVPDTGTGDSAGAGDSTGASDSAGADDFSVTGSAAGGEGVWIVRFALAGITTRLDVIVRATLRGAVGWVSPLPASCACPGALLDCSGRGSVIGLDSSIPFEIPLS